MKGIIQFSEPKMGSTVRKFLSLIRSPGSIIDADTSECARNYRFHGYHMCTRCGIFGYREITLAAERENPFRAALSDNLTSNQKFPPESSCLEVPQTGDVIDSVPV